MAEQNERIYEGIWQCTYWFPSNNHDGEDPSEYEMQVKQTGNKLILESLPNESGAYMVVRLVLNGTLATGKWEETTSPTGEFQGMIYSGALQLIVNDEQNRMDGMWVGVGRSHELNKPQIYSGRWELSRRQSQDLTTGVYVG